MEPIASRFTDVNVIPYVIPGRTGTQLYPQDLAILSEQYGNVTAVKEATGDLENMKQIRRLCGDAFTILSGDDDKTYTMMAAKEISASGVISVISNVTPGAIQEMATKINQGDVSTGEKIAKALKPLFEMVTVKTPEETGLGETPCKARNPLPIKTAMNILGMPAGPCRRPLGKMTSNGLQKVLNTLRTVHQESPEILEPVEKFFDVRLEDRLSNEKYWNGLSYDSY